MSNLAAKVRQTVNEAPWKQAYEEHPVVVANPGVPVVPLTLYMGGVQYQQRDTVQGWWVENLLTSQHHCFMAFRNKDRCRCGCRGWCSQTVLLQFAHWSFAAMARGVYPAARHDGTPWPPDQDGAFNAGEPMGFLAAVVMIKGDWSEYVHAFGFPSWQTHAQPCLFCFCTGGAHGTIREHAGVSSLDLPWPEKHMADYEAACTACENTCPRCLPGTAGETGRLLPVRQTQIEGRSPGARAA